MYIYIDVNFWMNFLKKSKINMVETVMHSLGLCGEPHIKLLDLAAFYSYIIENNVSLYVSNTWQKLKQLNYV
jgi:hypothetical protein